ncbi:MAG: response regulator [Geobacteraceae bacterium]|nr:response regulator [Geobacteraceae bacterium]
MAQLQHSIPAISLLLAEDDKMASDVTGLIIASKFPDVTIYFAENGRIGVELFKEHMPDIVITDINMPEMDGIEMAGEIKAIKADTRFIVLTGYSDEDYYGKFSQIGFDHYILKPVVFKELFAALEKCIAEIMLNRPSSQ